MSRARAVAVLALTLCVAACSSQHPGHHKRAGHRASRAPSTTVAPGSSASTPAGGILHRAPGDSGPQRPQARPARPELLLCRSGIRLVPLDDQIRARGTTRVLTVLVRNGGRGSCALSFEPDMSLVDSEGRIVPVPIEQGRTDPGVPIPPFRPGHRTSFRIAWSVSRASGGRCVSPAGLEVRFGPQLQVRVPVHHVTACGDGRLTLYPFALAPR